jgi:hypothetical protein
MMPSMNKDASPPTGSNAHVPNGPPPPSDRNPWYWLLLVPIVIPLLTFLYNAAEPRVPGFPRFYWMQLSFIGLGVAFTAVV